MAAHDADHGMVEVVDVCSLPAGLITGVRMLEDLLTQNRCILIPNLTPNEQVSFSSEGLEELGIGPFQQIEYQDRVQEKTFRCRIDEFLDSAEDSNQVGVVLDLPLAHEGLPKQLK